MLWLDQWEERGHGLTRPVRITVVLRDQPASNFSWRRNIHSAEMATSTLRSQSDKWQGAGWTQVKNSGLGVSWQRFNSFHGSHLHLNHPGWGRRVFPKEGCWVDDVCSAGGEPSMGRGSSTGRGCGTRTRLHTHKPRSTWEAASFEQRTGLHGAVAASLWMEDQRSQGASNRNGRWEFPSRLSRNESDQHPRMSSNP